MIEVLNKATARLKQFYQKAEAKKEKKVIDFDASPPAPVPNKIGITVIDSVKLSDVVPYIDWVSISGSDEGDVALILYLMTRIANTFTFLFVIESILPNMGVAWPLPQPSPLPWGRSATRGLPSLD